MGAERFAEDREVRGRDRQVNRSKTTISAVRGRETYPLPQLLSVQEVALVLGLSRSKVYQLVAGGDLLAYRPGGRIRVPHTAVTELLERTKL